MKRHTNNNDPTTKNTPSISRHDPSLPPSGTNPQYPPPPSKYFVFQYNIAVFIKNNNNNEEKEEEKKFTI